MSTLESIILVSWITIFWIIVSFIIYCLGDPPYSGILKFIRGVLFTAGTLLCCTVAFVIAVGFILLPFCMLFAKIIEEPK
jgi:hypothetical protein